MDGVDLGSVVHAYKQFWKCNFNLKGTGSQNDSMGGGYKFRGLSDTTLIKIPHGTTVEFEYLGEIETKPESI